TLRLASFVACTAPSMPAAPARTLDRPTELEAPRSLCTDGLRRSASTSTTRLPSCAMLRASSVAVVVLPSLGPALVTSRLYGRPCEVANCSAVRTERYDSANGERRSADACI